MFTHDQYELVDFGNGRRLERFADLTLDRPCPSARDYRPQDPALWKRADAFFQESHRDRSRDSVALGSRGAWKPLTSVGEEFFAVENDVKSDLGQVAEMISSRPWIVRAGDDFVLELKGSPFGHLGVFPEQADNWKRIASLTETFQRILERPIRVLNLFAYTGGSTLAVASRGADVTHLDAARNVVAQAKRNAELSFDDHREESRSESAERGAGKIRWIVDDAVKFVKREIKRNSFYDAIILDPPTYGHGARGEVWRLSRDLAPLLERCGQLLNPSTAFIMLSCHTPGYDAKTLGAMLRDMLVARGVKKQILKVDTNPMVLCSRGGAKLPCGDVALATIQAERFSSR